MKFRNAKYNHAGTIDCEIEHPKYGWIPCTINQDEYPDLYPEVLKANPSAYVEPPKKPNATLELEAASAADMSVAAMENNAIFQTIVDIAGLSGVSSSDVKNIYRGNALKQSRKRLGLE